MALKLTNNGTSTLAGSITDVATSLSVQAGDAGKFPTLAVGDWCPGTLTDASGNLEVVKVTARAGAVLTIERGQEGTTARAWASGDRFDLRMTVGALAALENPDAIHGATAKTTLAGADEFSLWDSVSTAFRKITVTNLVTAIGLAFASLTAKTSLVDADVLHLNDSAATNAAKAITWANFKATFFSALGALIAAGTGKTSPVDGDGIVIADSAASSASKLVTLTNLWTNYLKGKADALYFALANVATAANFRANTADKVLDTDGVWAAADTVALTDAATIAVDLSTFINASVTLAGNRTLGQPSNLKNNQSGLIRVKQDATGSRTLAYHADWEFAGGTAPVLTTTANAEDLLFYQVLASGRIFASLVKAVA